jgi:Zn finger protein HypA/HybF involved in hydrogenase expression
LRQLLLQKWGWAPPLVCVNPCVGFIITSIGAFLLWPFWMKMAGVAETFLRSVRPSHDQPGEASYTYQRTCRSCGFQWEWKPGQTPTTVRVGPDLVSREKKGTSLQLQASKQQRRSDLQREQALAYQPFLDELVSHWEGTHIPEPDFLVETESGVQAFFQRYQRALGEPLYIRAGHHATGFLRRYYPNSKEIQSFVGAYVNLRRGNLDMAVKTLKDLTAAQIQFADPWLWRSAVAADSTERRIFLEQAVQSEPAHPLAATAMAVARGDLSPSNKSQEHSQERIITLVRCSQCGGALRYEPSQTEVICMYCGHQVDVMETTLTSPAAPLVTVLRLQRLYQGFSWAEAEEIVSCRACGAELTASHLLAQSCAYCGSTNVIVQDSRRAFEQPDGILPFQIDEKVVINALRRDATNYKLNQLYGIYVPFWVFNGTVESRWMGVEGGRALWTKLDRKFVFDDLLLPGVDVPPISFLDQLLPFDMGAVVPYEHSYLADWPAQLYNLDVEPVVEDAYDNMLSLANHQAGPPVATGEALSVRTRNSTRIARYFQVISVTYQLKLLPVWVALVQKGDRYRLTLVHGQTGKVVGRKLA